MLRSCRFSCLVSSNWRSRSWACLTHVSLTSICRMQMSHFIEDMRRLVSFVNWHLTLLLEHSVQLDVSVASHCRHVSLKLSVPRALALETHFDFSFATRVATGILAALTVCALVGRQHSSGVVEKYCREHWTILRLLPKERPAPMTSLWEKSRNGMDGTALWTF